MDEVFMTAPGWRWSGSLAGEVGAASFTEGGDALPGVGRGGGFDDRGPLGRQLVPEAGLEALPQEAPYSAEGTGGAGGEAGGYLGAFLFRRIGGDDPADQAPLESLRGGEPAVEQEHLLGAAHAHQSGEVPGVPAVGGESDAAVSQGEDGVLGCHHHIG